MGEGPTKIVLTLGDESPSSNESGAELGWRRLKYKFRFSFTSDLSANSVKREK